ncbi:hypothetical protein GQ53DRAFT_742809 [Thozetella sp. PMI_491]|nr:hypothetical protein GQ53DRAFT_742809 [Thozetella sp. PMI_491]
MAGFNLLGGDRAVAPPLAAGEDVYPVHLLDDMIGVVESNPVVLMRFNDVLDADKLHASLLKVLEQGDWRKASGRFRRDASGRPQLRVPATFTPQRPALRYSHAAFDVRIEEHPLGQQLPKATDQPSLQKTTDHFKPFCWEPGAPGTLDEYLQCDDPPIGLRVTSFLDATLVAVSWSHVLADAVGFRNIVTAWCQVLAGRERDVAPVVGARVDAAPPIWESEPPNKEPYMWESKMLEGFSFLWFALRMVWQMIWQPKLTSRTLFLPASFISKLRQEGEKGIPEGSFISDGDLLCAWLSRLIASANSWTGPVALLNVVDIRSRVPSVLKPEAVYLQNLTMPSMTFVSARQLVHGPLGAVASEVRRSISMQTTEAQIRAIYRRAMPYVKSKGRPPVFGDPNMLLVPISNWTKAKFVETIDFSPAVIRPGDQGAERRNAHGTMLYQLTGQVKQMKMTRNTAVIIARDHSKNYWVNLYLPEAILGSVEEAVENISI